MALLFCACLLLYRVLFLRRKPANSSDLARVLWNVYFALGCCALIISATDVIKTTFEPNYASALFLVVCILISISGFLSFRSNALGAVIHSIRQQSLIESLLIGSQIYAILFFLPFAVSSLTGDVNLNRLELAEKMEMLGSYGLLNTLAGTSSQLFCASLVMAFVRLSQPVGQGRSLRRAAILCFSSFSYVVYILAYVGRDGVIYWLMTAFIVYVIFRMHLPSRIRRRTIQVGLLAGLVLMAPLVTITVSRFINSDYGVWWSVLDYFGSQLNTFSDYSSIDRPMTLGASNFPMFKQALCQVTFTYDCVKWEDLKPTVFDQYLAQGKEPWFFGTYVSDFVGDFGYPLALAIISLYAIICSVVCNSKHGLRPMTLARLLLGLFLFLVPYWGVFYFRFSIVNGFIVVNLLFVFFVFFLQRTKLS